MALNTEFNFKTRDSSDEIYRKWIDAHSELTDDESHAYNVRLLLLLMNHIGDEETLADALNAAKQ